MAESRSISSLLTELPIQGRAALTAHNRRILSAEIEDIRSPFGEGLPRAEILSKWQDILDSGAIPDWLKELESEESKKVGPMSLRDSASDRFPALMEYFAPHVQRRVHHSVLGTLSLRFASLQLQLDPMRESFNRMPKSTNLGLPWFSRQRKYAADYLERANHLVTHGYAEDCLPAVWFWRGQQGGPTATKQREVWGMDHLDTIVGGTWVNPLVGALRSWPEYAAWNSPDFVDVAVHSLLARAGRLPVFSGDFSSYDKGLSFTTLDETRDVISGAFSTEEARTRVRWSFRQIHKVEIATPFGVFFGRDGGMPSGTIPTNLVDGVTHHKNVLEVARLIGVRLTDAMFMGDDGLWVFDPTPPSKEVAEAFATLGFIANPEKFRVEVGRCHFLQRIHSLDFLSGGIARGVRSTMRMLGSAMSFEHRLNPTMWTPWMHTIRWIMQWENCRWHPLFKEFVTFLADNDVYVNKRDPLSIVEYAGGEARVKAALRLEGFPFRTRDISEFKDFETVRLLLQLRGGR